MAFVHYEERETIGYFTITAPPVNALSKEVFDDIAIALSHIKQSGAIDVLIIKGGGVKAFVAGANIHEFQGLTKEEGIALVKRGQWIFQSIKDLPIPTLAAIDGYALGGGLELALACDIRIATEKSIFGFPETTLGIIPGYGGTQRLPKLLTEGKAKQLIFTGEKINAAEAYRIGLIDELVTDSTIDEAATTLAKKITNAGPIAVRKAKEAIQQAQLVSIKDGLDIEARLFGEICETHDKEEGVQAFIEKRKPIFTGK